MDSGWIMNRLIKKYPKLSFMIIVKLYWIVSFSFTIFVIQGSVPTVKQWVLSSLFTVLTLPLNYWLTYGFTGENKND